MNLDKLKTLNLRGNKITSLADEVRFSLFAFCTLLRQKIFLEFQSHSFNLNFFFFSFFLIFFTKGFSKFARIGRAGFSLQQIEGF